MRINPKVLALALGMVLVVSLLVWSVREGRQSGTDAPTAEQDTKSNSEQVDQALTPKESAVLSERVRRFSLLYFAKDPNKSAQEARDEIEAFATNEFVQQAEFGFGDSEADLGMLREGAKITVVDVSDFVGEVDGNLAFGAVILKVQKMDRNGNVLWTNDRTQSMTWIMRDKTWMILEAPRT